MIPLLSLRRHDPDQVPRVLLSTSNEVRPEQTHNIGEKQGSGEERTLLKREGMRLTVSGGFRMGGRFRYNTCRSEFVQFWEVEALHSRL